MGPGGALPHDPSMQSLLHANNHASTSGQPNLARTSYNAQQPLSGSSYSNAHPPLSRNSYNAAQPWDSRLDGGASAYGTSSPPGWSLVLSPDGNKKGAGAGSSAGGAAGTASAHHQGSNVFYNSVFALPGLAAHASLQGGASGERDGIALENGANHSRNIPTLLPTYSSAFAYPSYASTGAAFINPAYNQTGQQQQAQSFGGGVGLDSTSLGRDGLTHGSVSGASGQGHNMSRFAPASPFSTELGNQC